jgi:fucose 4-O-acetylase-like acetyltransferase
MKREEWIDYARALACMLVALGHLVMSFEDANIVSGNFFVNFL